MAALLSALHAAPVMRQAESAAGSTPAFRSGHDNGHDSSSQHTTVAANAAGTASKPAIARQPTRYVACVNGNLWRKPPILRISCSSSQA